MTDTQSPRTDGNTTPQSRRRAVVAAAIGHAVESYDLAAYGFAAVYLGRAFFPTAEPLTQILATFGIFGLTFFVRPLGAVVFGPLADRAGRHRVLVLTLLLMFGSTTLIGVLPTYATAGVLAPIALTFLRLAQNLSLGGEAGAVTAFIAEHARPARRGFSMSWIMFSAVAGFMSGAMIVTALITLIGDEAMSAWGWRIPFLIALPIGAIGLYIRLKLEETPEFTALQASGGTAKAPLRQALTYRRALLTAGAITALHASVFYIVLTFVVSYLQGTINYDSRLALVGMMTAGLVALCVMPFFGSLSDRLGRRTIMVSASASVLVASAPLFLLMQLGPVSMLIAQAVFGLLVGMFVSTSLTAMTECFPTHVRTSGVSIAYMISSALFGGMAPFVATWLISSTGDVISPAYFLIATATVGLMGALALPRTPTEAPRQPWQ